jgi:hypothetical protein
MSSISPPLFSFSGINYNPAFFTSSDSAITLNYANTNYLKRVGTPNSVASATTFTGTLTTISPLSIGSCLLSATGDSCGFSTVAITALRATQFGIGANAQNDCTAFGYGSVAGGTSCLAFGRSATTGAVFGNGANNCVAIGSLTSTTFGINNQTAIGANSVCNGINSTAIGAGASATYATSTAIGAGATTTVVNSVVLGTTAETVYCPGTIATISLNTTKNVSINGACFGTGLGGSNSLFSGLLVGTGQGANNTLYGKGSYSSAQDGSSTGNTIIGAGSSNPAYGIMTNHTVVGYGAGGIASIFGQDNITCIGAGATVINSAANSTAIGYNSQSTLPNQIMLGRTQETVYCSGVPTTGATTYTSLVLSSGLQLQTVYTATPTANQLGFQLSNGTSGFAIASFIAGANTDISSAGIALTPGVWSINYTIDLLVAAGPATVSEQTLYVNTNSGAAFTSRIKPCGSTRIHTTFTYATSDTPSFSGAFTYYVSAADTIYPIFKIGFSTGTFSGTGYYVATRVG